MIKEMSEKWTIACDLAVHNHSEQPELAHRLHYACDNFVDKEHFRKYFIHLYIQTSAYWKRVKVLLYFKSYLTIHTGSTSLKGAHLYQMIAKMYFVIFCFL